MKGYLDGTIALDSPLARMFLNADQITPPLVRSKDEHIEPFPIPEPEPVDSLLDRNAGPAYGCGVNSANSGVIGSTNSRSLSEEMIDAATTGDRLVGYTQVSKWALRVAKLEQQVESLLFQNRTPDSSGPPPAAPITSGQYYLGRLPGEIPVYQGNWWESPSNKS